MEHLSDRQEKILKALVVEYIRTADPVPSDRIVSQHEIGAKSATVRSELSEMDERGLIQQMHTSAGREPTDAGYRYYVDHLMVKRKPTEPARRQIETASSQEETLNEILSETTKLLSRMTRLCAAAATLKGSSLPIQSAVITALGPERALLIMVLGNGETINRVMGCPPRLTLEDIGQANQFLHQKLIGMKLFDLSTMEIKGEGGSPLSQLIAATLRAAQAEAKGLIKGHVFEDGKEYLIAQPEFQRDPAGREELLRSLEDDDWLASALSANDAGRIWVTIGQEHQDQRLHPLSVARRKFFVGKQEAGAIAVVGPTRMDYERGNALLDFTANSITDTLTRLYG